MYDDMNPFPFFFTWLFSSSGFFSSLGDLFSLLDHRVRCSIIPPSLMTVMKVIRELRDQEMEAAPMYMYVHETQQQRRRLMEVGGGKVFIYFPFLHGFSCFWAMGNNRKKEDHDTDALSIDDAYSTRMVLYVS